MGIFLRIFEFRLPAIFLSIALLGFSNTAAQAQDRAQDRVQDAGQAAAPESSKFHLRPMYGGFHYQTLLGPEISWGYMLTMIPQWKKRGITFGADLGVGGVKASLGFGAFVPFYPLAAGLLVKLIAIQGWHKDSLIASDGAQTYVGGEVQLTVFVPSLRVALVKGATGPMLITGLGIGF